MDKKKEQNKKQKEQDKNLCMPLGHEDGIVTDPNGSYTGVPEDGGMPIQDADDL